MPWPELVALIAGGLAIGSFANVVIYRLPRGESVVAPGSRCPACEVPIKPWDNLPVVSWLILRGRCRACHAAISARYPLVEALCGGLFVVAGERFGTSYLSVAAACVLAAALVTVSAVDLTRMIIPDRVVFPALGAVAALLVAAAIHGHQWHRLEEAAIGAAASFAGFAAIHLAYPAGMGFGDVKLSLLIGLFLGWIRLAVVPIGFFIAFAVATVVSVVLIILGKGGRKTKIPFGPFMAVGAMGAVQWGVPIARAWLGH